MAKIQAFLRSLFSRLSLLDSSERLSLSNLAVLVCVVKIALTREVTLTELGALMIALINYGHKRHETNKSEIENSKIAAKLSTDRERLDAALTKVAELSTAFEAQSKIFDEARQLLTANKLTNLSGRKQHQL